MYFNGFNMERRTTYSPAEFKQNINKKNFKYRNKQLVP